MNRGLGFLIRSFFGGRNVKWRFEGRFGLIRGGVEVGVFGRGFCRGRR